jgi:hypothetical protein
VSVGGVALATRAAFGLPEPGQLQRVDGIHQVARGDQRLHPRTTIGLDPDHHLDGLDILIEPIIACNLATPAIPSASFALPSRRPRLVLQLDIVVLLGPIVAEEQQRCP